MAITLNGTSGITSPNLDVENETTFGGAVSVVNGDIFTSISTARSGGDTGTAALAVGADGNERFPMFYKSGGNQLRIRNAGLMYHISGTDYEVWHNQNTPFEAGTWTPSVNGWNSVTYGGNRWGYYRLIGNTLHLWARISTSTLSGPSTSAMTITGMPYAILASHSVGTVDMHSNFNTTAARPFLGLWASSTTSMIPYRSGPGVSFESVLASQQGTTNFDIIFSATCRVSV